jgi:hypothetical protein
MSPLLPAGGPGIAFLPRWQASNAAVPPRGNRRPGAALFHISVADMDTAMGWFRSDTFKEATRLAKVTGRSFYLAQPQA